MAVHIHTDAAKAENEMGGRKSRELVRAVGEVLELTDLTAASPLRVSSVSRGPKRALSVEGVMDLENEILWPEHRREQTVEIDDVDASRAQEYSLLAMLLSRSPDAETLGRLPSSVVIRPCLASRMWLLRRQPVARAWSGSHASTSRFSLELGVASASLRIVLSHRLSQRTAAGSIARGSWRARHRTRRRTSGAGGPRRHALRDHGRNGQWSVPGNR